MRERLTFSILLQSSTPDTICIRVLLFMYRAMQNPRSENGAKSV